MSKGLDSLEHVVVLMMENRSFDHMLGGLSLVTENGRKKYPNINGLTGSESNSDTKGAIVKVQPNDPDPDHHFPESICRFSVGSKAKDALRTCRDS
jgi:phospholipase C